MQFFWSLVVSFLHFNDKDTFKIDSEIGFILRITLMQGVILMDRLSNE